MTERNENERWVMVPVEPTHMMTLKAEEAFENDGHDYPSMRVIWAAMLAAAPQQPAPAIMTQRAQIPMATRYFRRVEPDDTEGGAA